VRVPAVLKRRADEAAQQASLSGNVWAMRCIERCLGGDAQDMARAVFNDTEIRDIDAWRDKYGIASRAEALRCLVGLALHQVSEKVNTQALEWMTNHGPGNETALKALYARAQWRPKS
jgi:hypothetical protein